MGHEEGEESPRKFWKQPSRASGSSFQRAEGHAREGGREGSARVSSQPAEMRDEHDRTRDGAERCPRL